MAGRGLSLKKVVAEKLKDKKFKQFYEEAGKQTLAELHIEEQLKQLRKESDLTQKELAERLGTKQADISRLEREGYAGHMTVERLIRFVRACGGAIEINVTKKRSKKYITKRRPKLSRAAQNTRNKK